MGSFAVYRNIQLEQQVKDLTARAEQAEREVERLRAEFANVGPPQSDYDRLWLALDEIEKEPERARAIACRALGYEQG